MADNGSTVQAPDFEQLADQLSAGLIRNGGLTAFWTSSFRPILDVVAGILGLALAATTYIATFLAKLMVQALQTAKPEVAQLTGVALEEVFGQTFGGGGGFGGDPAAAAQAVGHKVVAALVNQGAGGSGDGITPSAAPAEQFLGTLMEVAIRGWVLDLITEVETLGQVQAFNHLVEDTIQALGIGRLTRQALRPAIDLLIAQPMLELFQQQYRPKLLSEGVAVKQVIRGKWDAAQLENELGRQGWRSDQIEAFLNEARKFLPVADAERLARDGYLADTALEQQLSDQGYTADDAAAIVQALNLARTDVIVKEEIREYLSLLRTGEIDFPTFQSFAGNVRLPADELAIYVELAQVIASHPRRAITVGELNTMLAKNVISLGEYRDALLARGYSDADATLLELLQQHTLSDREAAQQQKKQIAADKAAAAKTKQAAAVAAAAQRKTDAAKAKADQRAFMLAKQQAASDAAVQRIQLTEQALVEREQAITDAQQQRLITDQQAAQARAQLKILEQEHLAQANASTATQTALDQEQVKVDAAQVQAQVTADQVAATTKAARDRAALDQQLLDARQADRVAGFQLARQSAQDSFDAGEITAKQLATKLRAIDLQEKKAIAAENVTQLRVQQATSSADAIVAKGAVDVTALQEKATLIPAATRARNDAIATALSGHLAVLAQTGTDTAAALADITSKKVAAFDAAAVARATLDQKIADARVALERTIQANKPKPPGA